MELNIIGDIAGRYDELQLLLAKMPAKGVPFSVGDMNDGAQSKEVFDFFMLNGIAINSNHGHMLVELYRDTKYYEKQIWFLDGGWETLKSFMPDGYADENAQAVDDIENLISACYRGDHEAWFRIETVWQEVHRMMLDVIPEKYIDWLDHLPMYCDDDDIIITHAPINPSIPFEKCLEIGTTAMSRKCQNSVLWNRGGTRRRTDGKFQVHGHMAKRNVEFLKDTQGIYGASIDTSCPSKEGKQILSGLHWPSMEIFTQEYLSVGRAKK